MPLGPVTRKWLITIIVAIAAVLLIVWIYTAWASEEVETEVTEPLGLASVVRERVPHPRDRQRQLAEIIEHVRHFRRMRRAERPHQEAQREHLEERPDIRLAVEHGDRP